MQRPLRGILFFVLFVLFLIIITPLVIPIPPLTDTVSVEQLADVDSRFIEVNGITVHYKQMGDGKPVLLLLHGFGASAYSWREVMKPLSQYGTVIAFDRPAFGLTERPLPGDWTGESPYTLDSQVKLATDLMDALNIDKAIFVGHSAGGTVALAAAIQDPQRVEGLILVDAAIYASGGAPGWAKPFLKTPQLNRLGPWFVRSISGEQGDAFLRAAWHDPSKITDEIMAGYREPLQVENWDVALWEYTKASRATDLSEQLNRITLPVLVISGEDDQIVPTEESIRLAEDMVQADLVIIPACGHLPQEEKPQEFLDATVKYLQNYDFLN